MKKDDIILFILIVFLGVVVWFSGYYVGGGFSKPEPDNDVIKKYNNCLIMGGTPTTYLSDEMVVEKCIPKQDL